jgi:hypothetical protein
MWLIMPGAKAGTSPARATSGAPLQTKANTVPGTHKLNVLIARRRAEVFWFDVMALTHLYCGFQETSSRTLMTSRNG